MSFRSGGAVRVVTTVKTALSPMQRVAPLMRKRSRFL